MITTTTHTVEGRHITAYLDIVSAESVQGVNVVRDLFAGMDGEVQVVKQRVRLTFVLEMHVVERNLTLLDIERRRAWGVLQLVLARPEGDHILHVADRSLEVRNLLSDIAKVAIDKRKTIDREHDLARSGPALAPQPNREADHARGHRGA